ncbi:MAG: twin-arginine translocase TatA/TatE family subunit [Bacteroidales bacterium]|nr:twin-arginine translocase TatA/TatE family subunit [Bacteroidales bacterium]MBQ4441107.1 twin-arginine translocase TatA/TatE family subunit [Bacteroidales bacterium]MCR4857404.1 twin-arginine translocase TatA/TatE family subunit [Bacteroidales bacterium]
MIGTKEILLILLVVLLLFGGKKIPELMRGMGKGVKSFKEGLDGIEEKPSETTSKTEEEKR